MDIMVILRASYSSGNLVGIKHHDQVVFAVALVIAEHVHQAVARAVQRNLHQLPQLVPGVENVVAVHQKVLLHRLFFFGPSILSRIIYNLARAAVVGELAFALAVGAGEDGLQLLFVSSEGGRGTSAASTAVSGSCL